MANITTEYLDKALKKQSKELTKDLKEYTDDKIHELDTGLRTFMKTEIKEEIESLARMTNKGFEDVVKRLDVKERVERLEKFMYSVAESFNMKI